MGGICTTMDRNDKRTRCIVISGIDGSGKTTVINRLRSELADEGTRTAYIWLRFNHYFTKIMHAFARLAGLSVKVRNDMGETWQHRFYKSLLFCRLYVIANYMDTCISRLKYDKAARHCDIVICDRWVIDILADLATKTRSLHFLDGKWPGRFLGIMPDNTMSFIIYRNLQDVKDCRLENRVDPDFQFRLDVYDKLMKKPFVHPVDNRGTVEESAMQIKKILNL